MSKKNIITIVLIVVFSVILAASIFSGVLAVKYYKCRAELEQCVAELRYVRESNIEYEQTFDRAKEYNSKLGECLSEQVYTIQGLREQLQEIYYYYQSMESCFPNRNTDSDDSLDDIDLEVD